MAEKEERKGELRIRINQFLWPTCKECGSKCKDKKEIKFCRDSQPGMPRQEAIERMARAIFTLRFTPLEIKGKGWNDLNGWQKGNCLRIAEAALNALLGE